MNRKLFALSFLSATLLLSACSAEPEEPVSVETTAPMYVERDDMLYAEQGIQISDKETTESAESEPVKPSDSSTAPSEPDGGGGAGTKPIKDSGGKPEDNIPPDSVYNTTILPNIDDSEATFGKIELVFYNNQTEDDNTDKSAEEGGGKTGIGTDFILGEQSYGYYRDNLLAHNGATFINEHFEIMIEQGGKSDFAFEFNGAGHHLKEADAALGPNFFLEVEKNGVVLKTERVEKIRPADGYNVAVKAIAVKLGEFERLKSTGYADSKSQVQLSFEVKTNEETHTLEVGMPYAALVDILGEGAELTADVVVDEESGATEEVTYYVYKTPEYTLIVEKQDYPDIKPEQYQIDEGVSPDTVLVKSIILIRNKAELPEVPDDAEGQP